MSDAEVERLLRELVRLTRVQVYPVARDLLEGEIFDGGDVMPDRAAVYAALDGRSQAAIAEDVGVSQSTVSRWSGEWKRKGLVDEESVAVFDVYDFFPELED